MANIDFNKIKGMLDRDPVKPKKSSTAGLTEASFSNPDVVKTPIRETVQQNYDEDDYGNLPDLTQQYYAKAKNSVTEQQYHPQPQQMGIPTNSKLPKSILESMINNPIEQVDPMQSNSVTARLFGNKSPQQMNRMTESVQNPIPQQINPTIAPIQSIAPITSGIDYSLIKTIIESVVSEKLKELVNDVVMLKIGKDLTVMDGQGNIYKSNFVKTGHIDKNK